MSSKQDRILIFVEVTLFISRKAEDIAFLEPLSELQTVIALHFNLVCKIRQPWLAVMGSVLYCILEKSMSCIVY